MTIYGHKSGKTLFTVNYSGSGRPGRHNHIAIVDRWGDGFTTLDENHKHQIVDGRILEAMGHGHRRMEPDEDSAIDGTDLGSAETASPSEMA